MYVSVFDFFGHAHTLWKNEKFTLTQKIFRQINYSVILLVKPLFSRNVCQKSVTVKFRFFHIVAHTLQSLYHVFLKKFRENNFFSNEFTIKLISRNNSQVIQNFGKPHSAVWHSVQNGNLLLHVFCKNFVKATFYHKNY